jgi:hypothetical protein
MEYHTIFTEDDDLEDAQLVAKHSATVNEAVQYFRIRMELPVAVRETVTNCHDGYIVSLLTVLIVGV